MFLLQKINVDKQKAICMSRLINKQNSDKLK